MLTGNQVTQKLRNPKTAVAVAAVDRAINWAEIKMDEYETLMAHEPTPDDIKALLALGASDGAIREMLAGAMIPDEVIREMLACVAVPEPGPGHLERWRRLWANEGE